MERAFKAKGKEWGKVIAQASTDKEFKAKLLANPKTVLKEEGIEFPDNIKVNITIAKEDEINLTLALKSEGLTGSVEELELSEDELHG
jgi:hypothetical protein